MQAKLQIKRQTPGFFGNFTCAGSSALLISVAHLYPEFWFVSLFALIPFLWRATLVSLFESIVLGSLLATSYCLVMVPVASWATPDAFLLKLLALNVLFALYGTLVNKMAKHIGFNAIFIAVLWMPLEYALSHYADLGRIFTFSETDSTLLFRIGSLFGMLIISFVVVLMNSLILLVLKRVVQAISSRGTFPITNDKKLYFAFKEIILERRWYDFPDPRAPPLPSSVPA